MPQTTPITPPSSESNATTSDSAAESMSSAGKTPEQIAKEKRIAELKAEGGTVCCGGEEPPLPTAFYVALYYSPQVALVSLAFIVVLFMSERTKNRERKSWRSWWRGRF